MERFSEECLEVFLREQSQLFDEPVAETPEEAEAFLEDCMAVVLDSLEEVRDYLDEYGADVDGMTLGDRKSTRLNSSHITRSRMPSSA